jgi:class 3 adenylate cyclase/tetratricopeptide (TPR) repeat protein
MNCPNCQSPIEETQKFCRVCGVKLQMTCSGCGSAILPGDSFCGECGLVLDNRKKPASKREKIPSERKYITVLFADISGYTALSERLDPEEVKDLVSHIIGEIGNVVLKYGGHIEKFAGDQVMAVFGVPLSHEEDPVRAVKTAGEIHEVVRGLSPQVQAAIGQSLAVHIGINTGLVVTGKLNLAKAAHHLAGDTINIASRLCTQAKAGETLVGQLTYTQTAAFFSFGPMEMVLVKGKTKPVQVYKLLLAKELPGRTHRASGRQAALIGRQREMAVLAQAMARLREGEGSVIVICGEAGTGKSRLLEEFQASLDLKEVRWLEGHAYAYTQNISYYPLINLIKRDLALERGDTPSQVVGKLEARLEEFNGLKKDVAPYIGGLLSLPYPEVAEMSPEFWKSRLHRAIQLTWQTQAQHVPLIVCFEDLQWADSNFLNFFRLLVREPAPVIFLCTYRTPFKMFNEAEISRMGELYREIRLQDLSTAEIQEMLASILQTTAVPEDLKGFIQEKVGTNPFYLEEMIHSLIESGMLQLHKGAWRLAGDIDKADIPSTIHAVIADRIDRLDEAAKHLLQEASVIGRTVPYEALKHITRHVDTLDQLLESLEDLALLRRTSQPELKYVFKHALIQDVVYNSLLKKDRQAMHRRIGLRIEEMMVDRLPEFYEALAFHFRHSDLSQKDLSQKAVHYLRESGKKSLQKYAVQESHTYYQRAFQILSKTLGHTEAEKWQLIDFLNEWALVFYYRADFEGFTKLFLEHQAVAESLSDKVLLAIFYAWLGLDLFCTGKPKESYRCSIKALELGQETGSNAAIGLAYSNLIWCCAELKRLDEGIHYGEEVLAKGKDLEPMSYIIALGGLAAIYLFLGDGQKNLELGRILLESGERHSDLRSTVVGYICTSYAHYSAGDFSAATEWSGQAIEISNDPLFTVWPQMVLASYYVQSEKFQEAEEILQEIIPSCRHLGMIYILTHAQALYGVVLIATGHFSRGLKMIKAALVGLTHSGRLFTRYLVELCLAEIYFQIATRVRPLSLWSAFKNLGFIMKEVAFARRKAIAYLNSVIKVGKEVGAKSFAQGRAWLNLGLLHQHCGRQELAKECLDEAQQILCQCNSEMSSLQIRQALAAMH